MSNKAVFIGSFVFILSTFCGGVQDHHDKKGDVKQTNHTTSNAPADEKGDRAEAKTNPSGPQPAKQKVGAGQQSADSSKTGKGAGVPPRPIPTRTDHPTPSPHRPPSPQ